MPAARCPARSVSVGRPSRSEPTPGRPLRRQAPAPSSPSCSLRLLPLHAQNAPNLAYVLPAGGQQGTAFEVTVGGQFLNNASAATVTGGGGRNHGRRAQPAHGRRRGPAVADSHAGAAKASGRRSDAEKPTKEMTDIRVKLLLFNAQRSISPGLAETVKLRVAIARGAAAGRRELRVVAPQGLSNPLVFCVGQLPEFTEKETIEVDSGAGRADRSTRRKSASAHGHADHPSGNRQWTHQAAPGHAAAAEQSRAHPSPRAILTATVSPPGAGSSW